MPGYMHIITKLRNLTPHPVNIVDRDGHTVTIPPDGDVLPRVEETRETAWPIYTELGDFETFIIKRGVVIGLPEKEEGVGLIVSTMVLEALHDERDDLLAPGQLIRDDSGKVVAAKGFAITRKLDEEAPF